MRATKTAEGWTLWASLAAVLAAVAGRQRRAELKLSLQNLRLTAADGVDPSDPYGSEAAYGPLGTVYRYAGLIVATDGSLKDNGRMGAAFVSMGNRLPGRSTRVGIVYTTRADRNSFGTGSEPA